MELHMLKHAARLARISTLTALQELAIKAIARGEQLDDFLCTLKSALEREMDKEAQDQILIWALR
jgi:hypothetical protein